MSKRPVNGFFRGLIIGLPISLGLWAVIIFVVWMVAGYP